MFDQSTPTEIFALKAAGYAAFTTLAMYSTYKLGTWAGAFFYHLSIEV
jgi:hypothetical protein